MDTLINNNDENKLKQFLGLAPLPEITLTYDELLGYFYGIAITPDLISPSEWIPVIFGDDMPEYESREQARDSIDTILTVLNRYISAFHDGSLFMPFDMANLTDADVDRVWEWTSGFDEALSLRPECWEEPEGLSEEERDHLMYSLIVIEGVVHPDDAMDMFDSISDAELNEIGVNLPDDEVGKAMQVQIYLLQALELAVETIQNHGAKLESQRQTQIRSSSVPFPVRSSKVDVNESCLCGSGKKYKDCCGKKAQKRTGLYNVKSQKGQGKIIKGDFPKRGKESQGIKSTKSTDTSLSGPIYQLEITLANTEPSLWRRVQVPSSMTLADLHRIIQLCIGWLDMHMHQFQAGVKFYGPPVADDYGDTPILDESRFQLIGLEREMLQGILYTYDFGDSWEHVISLEKVLPQSEAKPYPVLVDGSRACPPEDIGGPPGYQFFLEALANPEGEDYEEFGNIPGLEDYDPDYVGVDLINEVLKSVYGKRED